LMHTVGRVEYARLDLPFTHNKELDKCRNFVHTGRHERTEPDQARAVGA
jgi:hypothetical protein